MIVKLNVRDKVTVRKSELHYGFLVTADVDGVEHTPANEGLHDEFAIFLLIASFVKSSIQHSASEMRCWCDSWFSSFLFFRSPPIASSTIM